MKTSEFQFKNPILNRLNFSIKEDYNSKGEEIGINNIFKVNIERDEKNPFAIVTLEVSIGDIDSAPFFIECSMSSDFKWGKEVYDEQTITDLLSINAPSLLLGYIRPIVSQITNMSKYPAYNIPFYNFLDKDWWKSCISNSFSLQIIFANSEKSSWQMAI